MSKHKLKLICFRNATARLNSNSISTLNFKHILNVKIENPLDMNLQFIYGETIKNSLSCI